jgi:NTE family protein
VSDVYGIVLEGGGARGAYQVGAWQALRKLGLEYGGVAGTSVGALNGAMMVQGDLDRALEIWSDIRPSRILGIDEALYERLKRRKISSGDASSLLQRFKIVFRDGMDTAPLRFLLGEVIDEARIRAAGLEFGFVTFSLSTWSPLKMYVDDVPPGQLIDYLLAGARLPVFKRQSIAGRLVLDGGFYDNLPIDLLAARGFTRIIAVRLGGFSRTRWQETKDVEVTYIKPSESLGGMLDFSRERAAKNIKLGYFDTLKVFKGYYGRKYCLEVDRDEKYFLHLLLGIGDDRLTAIREEICLPAEIPVRRMLLERLVPLAAEWLGVGSAGSYREIVIALLERAAAASGVERFQIYSLDEFLQQVVGSYRAKRLHLGPVSVRLPKILHGNELLLRAMREPVLDRLTAALVASLQ